MPMTICTRISPETTQKYLSVARCEGVAAQAPSGSMAGIGPSGSAAFCEAYHQTMEQIPANSMMMLTPVHKTLSPVGRLPTCGSYGQLCVYDTVSPGRSAAADQAVQKMKPANALMRSGLDTLPEGMAYAALPFMNTSEKCARHDSNARAR